MEQHKILSQLSILSPLSFLLSNRLRHLWIKTRVVQTVSFFLSVTARVSFANKSSIILDH